MAKEAIANFVGSFIGLMCCGNEKLTRYRLESRNFFGCVGDGYAALRGWGDARRIFGTINPPR